MKSWKRCGQSLHLLNSFIFCAVVVSAGLPAFAGECPEDPSAIKAFADCEYCRTDVNNDGKLTTADLLTVKKCVRDNCADLACDADGDGSVSENDAAVVLNCIKLSISKKGSD